MHFYIIIFKKYLNLCHSPSCNSTKHAFHNVPDSSTHFQHSLTKSIPLFTKTLERVDHRMSDHCIPSHCQGKSHLRFLQLIHKEVPKTH